MQQNINYPYIYPYPQTFNPNAVNINILAPQAYSGVPIGNSALPSNFYSLYGANPSNMQFPSNYNNIPSLNQNQTQQAPNSILNNSSDTSLREKTLNNEANVPDNDTKTEKKDEKKKDEKVKTILTDDYVKSLENYLDNDNPKIRLIGAKELLERFKEDPKRKDNPSLIPLVNKTLRDISPSVRFLGLTMLQTGYCSGDEETIQILKEIQSTNKDGLGDDALRASEILLNMSLQKAQAQ